ncbi:hypothetical protein AALK46_12930 [Staphylococcus nepalensis]|uniref:hypothetical protein n=1 Tax=Staphylococcus nepalensis TaxID=214473 RepID=UPI00351283CE
MLEQIKNKAEEKFEELFNENQNELSDSVYRENQAEIEPIINEMIDEEGFPNSVTMLDVDVQITVLPKLSFPQWVEEMFSKEEENEIENNIENESHYLNFVLGNIELASIKISIEGDPEDYKYNPLYADEEIIAQELDRHYDVHIMEEEIKHEDTTNLHQKVKEQLLEESGNSIDVNEVDIDTINFEVYDIKLEKEPAEFADEFEMLMVNHDTIKNYVETQFYSDLIERNKVFYEVEITDDIQDIINEK